MDIIKFISESLFIVVVATYVMGVFLKQNEAIKDKYIPLLLMGFAIIFCLILEGFTALAFLQGVLSWGVATGVYNTGKQLGKEE